jgi:hypothetical protein
MPLAVFAPRDSATVAFAGVWSEFESRVRAWRRQESAPKDRWKVRRRAVEALMARLESSESQAPPDIAPSATVIDMRDRSRRRERETAGPASFAGPSITHRFDTEAKDLERLGHAIELHEYAGRWVLVTSGARVQIDRAWALDILSGTLSPLAALERRIGRPAPPEFEAVRKLAGGQTLQRVHSRLGESESPSRSRLPDSDQIVSA